MIKERDEFFNSLLSGVVISSLTFLTAALIPFFGSAVMMMSPLPILYYYSRNGRMRGLAILIISLSAVALILTFYDSMVNFPILFLSGCLGIILSEVLKKSYSIEITILIPVIVLLIIWSSFILYESIHSGVSPQHLIESYISRTIQDNIQFYGKLDVPEETLSLIRDSSIQIIGFFMNIFPSLALISATFTVWINILSGKELFQKKSLWYPDFGDLSCWKTPEKLIWLFITGGGMLLIPVEWIRLSGLNILIICLLLYLFHGLAIISFFFRRKNIPRSFRVMFYFLIFAQQYVTLLVVATGLFDLWVDFRKYIKPNKD